MNAAKKKEIGDPLAQTILTHKIGGKQPSSTPVTQTSNSPDIQQSDTPASQAASQLKGRIAGLSDTQTSEQSEGQQAGYLKVQQPKTLDAQQLRGSRKRVQKTVYLPPDLAQWITMRALLEGREISDIATDLFQTYREACEQQEQKKEGKS